MNTNEPKIELPPCKAGYRWEYKGKVIDIANAPYAETVNYTARIGGEWHYWEAVPNPKTVKQRLETLPEGYRERALANCQNPDEEVSCLLQAVFHMGSWGNTPEGMDFWHAVYKWSENPYENPLPPLPDENPHTVVAAQVKADYVTKLERENAELREWKRQQIEEALKLNIQSVGAELGMKAGTPIAENILPAIRKLKAKLAAQEPDHTEGGKYRMLEAGEHVEKGDEYFWHDKNRWQSVPGYVGRPFDEPFWGSPVRRPVTPQPTPQEILVNDLTLEIKKLKDRNAFLESANRGFHGQAMVALHKLEKIQTILNQ
jgi:hypothetical protein